MFNRFYRKERKQIKYKYFVTACQNLTRVNSKRKIIMGNKELRYIGMVRHENLYLLIFKKIIIE
jgi:hypothetical protein